MLQNDLFQIKEGASMRNVLVKFECLLSIGHGWPEPLNKIHTYVLVDETQQHNIALSIAPVRTSHKLSA